MKQELLEQHHSDGNANPTGGRTVGVGIQIDWQDGPLGRGEDRQAPNGAFVEGVIQAALGRLEFYQASKFTCPENGLAIIHLKHALEALQSRTAKREERAVEGTHEA